MTSIAAPAVPILPRRGSAEKHGVFRNTGGKVVGQLSNDGYLEKVGLDRNKHRLRSYGGWATETAHIDQLRQLGGRGVRLVLVDGTILESRLSAWEEHGFRPKGLESEQTVLPDRYWYTASTPLGRQLALAIA